MKLLIRLTRKSSGNQFLVPSDSIKRIWKNKDGDTAVVFNATNKQITVDESFTELRRALHNFVKLKRKSSGNPFLVSGASLKRVWEDSDGSTAVVFNATNKQITVKGSFKKVVSKFDNL
jgi:hypothetical protein